MSHAFVSIKLLLHFCSFMGPEPTWESVQLHGKFTWPQHLGKNSQWTHSEVHWAFITVWREVWDSEWLMVACMQNVFGYSYCHAHRGQNSHHVRTIACWQHICLIFLAHLPWPVSVIIMCECVCVVSVWLSVCVCVVGCFFLINILCFPFVLRKNQICWLINPILLGNNYDNGFIVEVFCRAKTFILLYMKVCCISLVLLL